MLTYHRFCFMLLLLTLNMSALLTAGCWDRKEIENRGYVLGMTIDHTEPEGTSSLMAETQQAGSRKYRVTYELPKFRRKQEETASSADNQHIIFAAEGESMFAITREINSKTYFGLFLEDLQILAFSESVAKEGVRDLFDFFLRDVEMRRRARLLVAEGRADAILKTKLKLDEVNSIYIYKIGRNVNKTPTFADATEFGDLSDVIHSKRAVILPIIKIVQDDVKLSQGAVLNRELKMVGKLDEQEIIGSKLLRRTLKQGIITIKHPSHPDKIVTFELYKPEIKVQSHFEANRLWFTLEAKLAGDLGENMHSGQEALDPAFQHAVEKAVADEYIKVTHAAYTKLQELKADPVNFADVVRRQQPQLWRKIQDRWDEEIFPTVPLEVNIKVVIRRTGMTR